MKSVGLLVIIIVAAFGYAQAPDTVWTKTYGGSGDDVGYSVLQTNDGGYIIVGSTESFGAGGKDAYIVRTNTNGDTIWTKCYGGSEDDELYEIQPTLDGNYIIVGYTESYGQGGKDIWLLKVDVSGDTMVTQTIGGSGDDVGYSVQPTSDSAYVITGYVPMGFYHTVFLLKTHLDAWYDWMQTYTQYPIVSQGNSVLQTSDGGYIAAADYDSVTGWLAYWVKAVKTDADGDTIWITTGRGGWGGHILQVADGYVVAGTTGPNGLYSEFFLLRIDANGDSLWDKIVYSHEDRHPRCRALQHTHDGGYIIAGSIGYGYYPWDEDIILVRADANGDSLWNKIFGGADYDLGYSAHQTSDNGYIITGYTESYGAGGSDVYLIKTEPDVGVQEQPIVKTVETHESLHATILSGPLQLPKGKECKVFDITGRVVEPDRIQPGIYFIEVDGVVTQKVVKVR